MTKNIKICCNITFKDYLRYCFYPKDKKRTLTLFLVLSGVAAFVGIALLVLSFINKEKAGALLFPYFVFIMVYITIFIMGFMSINSGYKKNKKAFSCELIYTFLNNKMTIALPEKEEETVDIFIEKIYSYTETKKKVFITLINGKYYMVDKKKFIEGNLQDLRQWANKHIKLIKLTGI